jgi:hypothetical protein
MTIVDCCRHKGGQSLDSESDIFLPDAQVRGYASIV